MGRIKDINELSEANKAKLVALYERGWTVEKIASRYGLAQKQLSDLLAVDESFEPVPAESHIGHHFPVDMPLLKPATRRGHPALSRQIRKNFPRCMGCGALITEKRCVRCELVASQKMQETKKDLR